MRQIIPGFGSNPNPTGTREVPESERKNKFTRGLKRQQDRLVNEAKDAAKALPKVPRNYVKVLVVGKKVVNFVTK